MLECLLYGEVNLLCITMLSIMIYKVTRAGTDASIKKKTFVLSMLFALLLNVLDILWEIGFTKMLPVPPVAMHFINTVYFLSMSCMGLCFFLFSDIVQGRMTWRDPTFWLFASLPILLLTTLSIASFSNGCFMYFDADGNYCRGPLFYLQHILSFGYVAIASVKNLVGMVSRRTYAQKENYGILFSFVVPPAVCIVLQCFFQWVPILSVAPTISFLLNYTSSLQSQLSLDPLTGIYNRRQILLALSDRMHSVPKNRELYFFFLDVNAFKTINDTYGHYDGDRILQRVADALQSVCAETKGVCGRYGGDEFAYMQDFQNEGEVEQMATLLARRIRERCAGDDRIAAPAVTVSIGWARYDRETDDLPALIERADQRMYARKAQTKRQKTADKEPTMKDSDERILEKDLLARAFSARYNGCLLIDVATGAVRSVSDALAGDLLPLGRFDGTPYDRQIRALTRRLVPRLDRALLAERLMLSVIREKLDADGRYRVDFHSLDPDGTTVFHRVAYEYLDDRRDTILLLCEDVTDLVTGETDPLTGGYNMQGFGRQVRRWLAANPGRPYRMLRYNIDRFRDINGVYGHELGDRLLRDIAACMRQIDGPDSFSAHLNADHFVRFCAADVMAVEGCYAHFTRCFSGYRRLNFPLTLHIGVYDLCEEGIDPQTMSYKALLAMQSIKGNMQKNIAYYESGMLRHEQEQMELLNDIDRAIREEEFEVWFQPQVRYDECCVFSAEALVRWRHPRRGLLPPGEFIPLLEKSNYITKVDRYIIEKTCRYMRAWMDRAPAQTVQISVNLSREDVLDAALLPFLRDTVRRYEVPPAALHLEITESAYIEDAERLIEAVAHLREAGFPVELDDFGAGYSSLNTLKDIAADKLKLDMKFLSGDGDLSKEQVIIAAVIRMAHALSLPIIAEGVETRQQAAMLLSLGCHQMQGYYFSRPIPAADYEDLLFGRTALPPFADENPA